MPSKETIKSFLSINDKARNIFGWIEWILNANLPFTFADSEYTKKYASLSTISSRTLQKYIIALGHSIEDNIKQNLPEKFGIVIDGWKEGTTHYIAIFAAFADNKGQREQILLTITPPIDETNYNAETHAALIVDTLDLFDHKVEDLLILLADNTNLNPAIANILHIPMIGCASDKFNLAVQHFLSAYKYQIEKVNALMSNLKNIKVAGKLRQYTSLEPITHNITRWPSNYCMKRYLELRPFLDNFGEIITTAIPRSLEDRVIKEFIDKHLTYFEQVTKYLQKDDISLTDVRDIFDECIQK